MSLTVNIGIAKRHLLSRKRQSLIAMLGVTFGIAMFILMISFMQGVNQFLNDVTLASTPDIRIYNDIRTDYTHSIAGEYFHAPNQLVMVHHPKPKQVQLNIKNANAIIGDIKRDPTVAAVSPLLSTQVFYTYGPVQINGIIAGVNIVEEARLYGLADKIVTGRFESLLTSENGILMGQGLADKLNVRLGDLVTLATPAGTAMRFRIVGTFKIGIGTVDNIKSYVSIAGVQQLLGKDRNYITDINIKLKDMKEAKPKAALYQAKYGYKADDWETANSSIMAGSLVRNILTVVVSITLLVVAGFGIYNIMNMTIVNKMKDIAILKAQGFAGKDLVQIFLFQSLAIGVIGALVGLLLGFLLSFGISQVPFPKSDFISLKYFPVVFRMQYYVFGILFGVITTFCAGILPSVKASKIDPVAILRG
jgi:lipoprotein-releasing system permease protein